MKDSIDCLVCRKQVLAPQKDFHFAESHIHLPVAAVCQNVLKN